MAPPINSTKNKLDVADNEQTFFFSDNSEYFIKIGYKNQEQKFGISVFDRSEENVQTEYINLEELDAMRDFGKDQSN